MSLNPSQSRKALTWSVEYEATCFEQLAEQLIPKFQATLIEEDLNDNLKSELLNLYIPLADWMASKEIAYPLIIGVNGAQGSGKSTLCRILKPILEDGFNKSVLCLSLDDFYFSKKKRLDLASTVHPLLETRGVPGTHDVERLTSLLSHLKENRSVNDLLIPVFDKSKDDVVAEAYWRKVDGIVDIVLLEGWCVGAKPQTSGQLEIPINILEEKEDSTGYWREYVNNQLKGPYQTLFDLIDCQVMLKVPDMESVINWRCLQEEKLAKKCKEEGFSETQLMSKNLIARFIMYFERITQECLQNMPSTADLVLQLNHEHYVDNVIIKS